MTDWTRLRGRLTRGDYRSSPILLGLDFDGTLADIVDAPHKAALSPRTRRLLTALAARPDVRVAILSGRALSDLSERVGLAGVYYGGNHGLQIDGPGYRWTHPHAGGLDAALWRPLQEDLKDIPGAFVENKGLGLSVHYRNVPRAFVRRLADRVRRRCEQMRDRFRILPGKKTFDIRSSHPWDKGHALEAIRSRLDGSWKGIFIGDDRTDEEGFRTLGARAMTIRVGRTKTSHAQFVLSTRIHVDRILETLARRPANGS